MGLDMYLERRKWVDGQYSSLYNVKGVIDITKDDKKIPINLDKLSYVVENVAYWRKANAIHKWFVDNVQDGNDDCREYDVSLDSLKKLLDVCKQVKEKAILVEEKVKNGETWKDGKWEINYEDGKIIQNAQEIASILPTRSGFFFGSTEYDEWYLKDVEDTIKNLEDIIADEEKLNQDGIYTDFIYIASW